MCGIAGKIYFDGRPVDRESLVAMTDALVHRGPDDSGQYISPDHTVGLGHRRLSIIDLSPAGHQPMAYHNEQYWIVFNGEIYNYQEQRRLLAARGYQFHSESDTEVILALYQEYGPDCLAHLRGMFSFALYDRTKEVLFCARDRLGKKPFKYYWDRRVFMFASELKAILTQNDYRPEPDFVAIHHYLTLQYCPAPFTGFRGIHKLEPGHYLLVNIRRGTVEKKRYWHLDYSKKEQHSENEWQHLLREKLREAVRLRMIADVPLGAFLSGGVDSSAVVALMSEQSKNPIKTFSIGFSEQEFSELPYARRVANLFHTDHTEFHVTPETIEILPELVAHYEEPYADSSALPTYYLSKLAREHVTVALNGDGGDENFAGYSRYNIQKFSLLCDSLGISSFPGLRAGSNMLANNFPSTFSNRLRRFSATLGDDYRSRYANYICYFSNPMKSRLYNKTFTKQVTEDTYSLVANLFTESCAPDPLDQTLYADVSSYLPEDLLVKVDIASMASSLEGRSPFLDHELMELTARMPFDLKLRGWRGNKYILKKALADMLPADILHRPKRGFVLPIERWFRGDLGRYAETVLLNSQNTLTQHIFDREEVRRLITTHTTTSINLAPPLWALLTLELWYQHYFAR